MTSSRLSSSASNPASLLLAALALGALACSAPEEHKPNNLIVISLDTLRADALGCYGNAAPTSPAIDAVAAEGTLFEVAYATSPWTLPSHASLLTGVYARGHGASRTDRMRSDIPHLATVLREHGFETRALVNSIFFPKFGLIEAFDRHQYLPESFEQRTPSAITDEALGWLKGRTDSAPFFLFLHYYDAHSDYVSQEEIESQFLAPYSGLADGSTRQLRQFREGEFALSKRDAEHLTQRYHAGVRQLDDEVGRLIEFLKGSALGSESLIVIVADHGEEFLEHGGVLHGQTYYDEIMRIPMIFHGPDVAAGLRSARPVSLIDVMPTALGLLGAEIPSGLDGLDLRPFNASTAPPRRLFFESNHASEVGARRAVFDGRYKLHLNLDTEEQQLFDLQSDPQEQHDIAKRHPQVLQSLRSELDAFVAESQDGEVVAPLSESELEHLRALGYTQ